MQLSRDTLDTIPATGVVKPAPGVFELPVKVLQFGTGVLLRGLCDYFIDKANRNGIFNGRVVVVKSTSGGDIHSFWQQDNLYTLCVRGIQDGRKVEENIICAAIRTVLSAKDQWNEVLDYATSTTLQVIISNTTEVGLQLVNESIHQQPPASYPAKLLALLYQRWKAFGGSAASGLIIIPTELISDNGKKLFSIVESLAQFNQLETDFMHWLKTHNRFCNSLVDRIVPGKPSEPALSGYRHQLGYRDELLTVCEHYRLWAIECDDYVRSVLSFSSSDEGVVIAHDIEQYKELKLRMLNATHTLTCGLAYLCGINTVKEGMQQQQLAAFVEELMLKEIAPAIPCALPDGVAHAYGLQVLDRFRNPYLDHHWINITLQYSSKIRMRVIPVLLRYYDLYAAIPTHIALGFAAYICFMKTVKQQDDIFYGELNGQYYRISDDKVQYLHDLWNTHGAEHIASAVLQSIDLWGADLSRLEGFTTAVNSRLQGIMRNGAMEALLQLKSQ